MHVTIRTHSRSLRKQQVIRTVLRALRDSNRKYFRITQYSVQTNHLHLIVEADDERRLSSGMHGLVIRLALRVNAILMRHGPLSADRWYGVPLLSARQVRNTLVYVLQNRKKHARRPTHEGPLDPLSSAEWFDGFAAPKPPNFHSIGPPCIESAQSSLLRTNWRRLGLIHPSERPRPQCPPH